MYSVYYHIYSGTDYEDGIRYRIFLTDDFGRKAFVTGCPPVGKSSRSLISSGDYVDASCEFFAGPGYNQICIDLNGQLSCGFGKATTSFGLNYLSDYVALDDSRREITTAEECSPNYYGPVINTGVIPIATPTTFGYGNTGIERVCSIENPGKGTNSDQWTSVGSCGTDDLGIDRGKCWLDKSSINIAIKGQANRQELLAYLDNITNPTPDVTLDQINELINKLNSISRELLEPKSKLNLKNNEKEIEKIVQGVMLDDQGNYRILESRRYNPQISTESKLQIARIYTKLGTLKFEIEDHEKPTKTLTISGKDDDLSVKYCRLSYDDRNIFNRNIRYQYNLNEGKWYLSQVIPFRENYYKISKVDSIPFSIRGINNEIVEDFRNRDSDYQEGIKIILQYMKNNPDDQLTVYAEDNSNLFKGKDISNVDETLDKVNNFCNTGIIPKEEVQQQEVESTTGCCNLASGGFGAVNVYCSDKKEVCDNPSSNIQSLGWISGGTCQDSVCVASNNQQVELPADEENEDDSVDYKLNQVISGNKDFILDNPVCDGPYCAGFVTRVSDYIFGYGKHYITGVGGNAWDIPEYVLEREGNVIWIDWKNGETFTNYNDLNPGDVVGFYNTQTEIAGLNVFDLTHVALYLGKKEEKHYIIHLYHVPDSLKKIEDNQKDDAVRIENLESFLRLYDNFKISAIIKPKSEKLYKKSKNYEVTNYIVQPRDTVISIAEHYTEEWEFLKN